eukprot:gnl/TRDRNA2_/TRDRNA2_130003_c1_seq1.p1 gnl/TRDRNA2_/TRDRNA2_130003_c1~~gnl/TRDRNA2_/TRDRNA2_130003_c1_seq1.p1  ORF type:complete len:177 (+),score=34.58 gnl/TRDRNA2_/TRDRNA2_130003_c1_seq1:3-533(+)
MIFRPVNPHIICGGYINIQGVFLKRQTLVAKEMTRMICSKLIYARKMMEFIVKSEGFPQILEMYQRHMSEACDRASGSAKLILPVLIGPNAIANLKEDVVNETLEELHNYSKEAEEYMDRTFDLVETIGPRLAALPPKEFEGMLRPVFQQDEWMILLLGAILGLAVGTMQAVVLKN